MHPAPDDVMCGGVVGSRVVAGRRPADDACRVDRLRTDGDLGAQARGQRVRLVK